MGTKIKEILQYKEIRFEDLANRRLAVDTNNILYQFLSSIRQRDGTPLTDSQGRTTSHLAGLFQRSMRLMSYGMNLAYVFDGKAPSIKSKERSRRAALKEEAQKKYELSARAGCIEDMKKYASRTSRLTSEMIAESKELINALGCPVVQAPSEGEAQAALIVKNGDAYASISQDFDSLLFGVKRLVQNLTVSERRKIPRRLKYETVKPRMIELKENLNRLGLTQEELVVIGILVGTDFNYGGVKGIGPKKALKLVKEHKDFDKLFQSVNWTFDNSWHDIYNIITAMPTTDDYTLQWKPPDYDKIIELLCEEHGFSKERIENTLNKYGESREKKKQSVLDRWF